MTPYTGTVAVTGLNATDNPGPGVAVARCLREDPAFAGQIIGLAYDALDPGLYMPGLLDAAFLIPYPSAGRSVLFERLAYIQRRVSIDVLLPNLDSELPALIGQEAALHDLGIKTLLPSRDQYDEREKASLSSLSEKGIPVPRSTPVFDAPSLLKCTRDLGLPIVVKGVFYGATVAYAADEAVAAFHTMAATWGLPVVVQQFIPGEDLNVCVIGDGAGGLVGAVAMKKLVLTDKGKGWAGVTILDPALMELSRQIVATLKWRGPCEIEVRRAPDGGLHLLEINPRFPAWVHLTAGAGQNHPLAAVRLAEGQSVAPMGTYQAGTAFVRIALDQIVNISQFESISTAGEVLESSTPFVSHP